MITYKYMYAETADKEALLNLVKNLFHTNPFAIYEKTYNWSYKDRYGNYTYFYLTFSDNKDEMLDWLRQDIYSYVTSYHPYNENKEKVQFSIYHTGYGITADEVRAIAKETDALDYGFEFYMDWGPIV